MEVTLINILSGGLVVMLASLSSSSAETTETAVQAMFVFGGSLVDVGNNNHLPGSLARADFPHNGIYFLNQVSTGRFSNGKNSADWLAEKLGLPTPPPYLSLQTRNASSFMAGVSFASGGSLLLNSRFQNPNTSIGFADQIGNYEKVYQILEEEMGSSEANILLSESIFTIVIGSNDIFLYHSNMTSSERQIIPPSEFVNLMAATLKDHITILYEQGARKFVVAGPPLLGCTPKIRREFQTHEACSEEHNSMAAMYNHQLKDVVLEDLKIELAGSSYSYLDTFNVLQDFIQNPLTYGFGEVNAACCGLGYLRAGLPCFRLAFYCPNRSDHVFWDFVHPTEAAAKIIVDAFFDDPNSHHIFPTTLSQAAGN